MVNTLLEPVRADAPAITRRDRQRFIVEEAASVRELRRVWNFGHAVIVSARSHGRVAIVPANTRVRVENDTVRVIATSLEPGFVISSAAGLSAACAELTPVRDANDPLVVELVRALKMAIAGNPLFAETLATTLAMHLMSKYGRNRSQVTSARGGLGRGPLAAVIDYIHENPGRELCVKDLAEIAGVSLSHFIRTFHQTTGVPPHQYLLRTRLNRAKELLRQTRHSIAEIAGMTGFSGQSHFTKQFGRFAGLTPRRYRLTAG
jgi:AraC family transcriptional regulator